eukprot:CAMPEP_0197198716 /NCGR_PEP_ID=MMETSP1423-20130617/33513_1 /TAXON_ID=476441 /ORGANISM="Pseudo-nitzschia heimii, Strain UNC1101" /LENGTH=602 /DNA_ID=CAMNT_0042652551 /DNA_START=408 /DNA_END=2216 /DNA_ORIENTATION=+
MDDFYYEDNGDQHYFIRHGFRDNFESDGKEGEKSTEIGKSGYNELSDKKENRRRSEREKDAQVQSIENKERSREASKPEENQAEKSREARNIEDDEDSSEDNSAEEESVDNLGKPLDTEDFQQVDEDQNSDDEERSDEAKNSEVEKVKNSADVRDKESQDMSDDDDMYFRDPNVTVANWSYFPHSRREPRRDPSWTNATSAMSAFNKKECDPFMNNIDTSPPPQRKPSNEACVGYDGVLHINHYDGGGASGTSFFLFTIGMLAWADQHNYLPWIHVEDDFTKPIWDPIVHTNITKDRAIEFEMMTGMEIGWARDPDDPAWHIFPGKPYHDREPEATTFKLTTTGVWEHYFLPPNDFVPGDSSCRNKPIVKMNDDHIVPGIHANAPWAPRAWRYVAAPNILLEDLPWDDWFKPQRQRGAEVTERYIRFNPMMERRADCSFPNSEFSLGMHIRHGDKYIEREVIETDTFLAFAKAFVKNGGGSIYVATDSSKVIDTILTDWPKYVVDHVVHQSSVKGLSSNQTAAFDLGISAHRTNIEALTDVLALSKSTFFLHGLSAMSEAVFYLNPGLVERSINLEDEVYHDYKPKDFVKNMMPLGKTHTEK